MALTSEKKGGILAQFRRDRPIPAPRKCRSHCCRSASTDSASTSPHTSAITPRVAGWCKLVNQRRKLLDYLKSTQPQKYQELVERLGLRR